MELVFLSGEISLVGLPSGLISPTFFSTKADQCFLKILDTFFLPQLLAIKLCKNKSD